MEEFYAIGKKVKAARKSLGLTQKELAEKTGYTESGISRVEKGEIDLPVSKIKVLATTLRVPVDYLIGEYLFQKEQDPAELIKSLPKDQREMILKLIDQQIAKQEAEAWQQQNGTASAGDSESQRTV